ncbi:Uncharacterised protein [Vibrio cholerae]|nr:Uncharacterised protein [Vibrio cholerae]
MVSSNLAPPQGMKLILPPSKARSLLNTSLSAN